MEVHKGEEIGSKEGTTRLRDEFRNFLIAFKSLIIASHPVQRNLVRTHFQEHGTLHSQVLPRPPNTHTHTHTHTHMHATSNARTHLNTVTIPTQTHTHTHIKHSPPLSSCAQPSISRYTGEALARLRSRPWISLMFSLMCGSLCQHPSIRSYTSLGQVLGRCSTRPWVIHSITYRGKEKNRHQRTIPAPHLGPAPLLCVWHEVVWSSTVALKLAPETEAFQTQTCNEWKNFTVV